MVRNFSRRSVLVATGSVGALSIAGCLDGFGGSGDDADARVGVLQPVTGDLGPLGGPIRDAALLPEIQLSNEGVDFEIDIRDEDTEDDAEAGISAAQALADAGYPSVTGAANSTVTIAVAEDVFFPNEIVGISPASTSPDITPMDGDYLLRTCPTDGLQGEVMADIGVEVEGAETVSTLYLNNDYGQGLNDAFVDAVEAQGGSILSEVSFDSGQTSYGSELQSALEDEPDLLMIVGYPESGELIFREYYSDFDDGTTIIVPDGLQDGDLPGNVDNPMSNVVGTAPAAVGPGRDTFDAMYVDEFDTEPSVYTANAYDATAIHILANIAADELNGPAISEQVREVANPGGEVVGPDNLAEALEMVDNGEEVQYQGASGEIVFDENGDLSAATYDIFEFDMDGYEVTDQYDF